MKVPTFETRRVVDLVEWDRNPRIGHAVDKIARSIEAFGFINPIVVQKGTNRVIAGHGRLAALKRLGVEEVPVAVVDLDDAAAALYGIADNKLTDESYFDFTRLADLLADLDDGARDLTVSGIDAGEIERIAGWTPPAALPSLEGWEPPKMGLYMIIEFDNEVEMRAMFERLGLDCEKRRVRYRYADIPNK